jgi:hypothetical protein
MLDMWTLKEEVSRIEIGRSSQFRNLTLFPLFPRNTPPGDPDYMLLEDAIAQGKVQITELPSGGSVPELSFTNWAELPVLLVDGEELVGAKQNRVLNLTILAPARQTIVIPVSCVEAGRWDITNSALKPSGHVMYMGLRGKRVSQVSQSIRFTGSRSSDQAALWKDIADRSERLGVASPTRAMSAIYEQHAHFVEEFDRAFTWQTGQIGVAFAMGGDIVGLEVFDHPEVMRKFLGKLVRSYALDLKDAPEDSVGQTTVDYLTSFLAGIGGAQCSSERALGLGKDVRFFAPQICGAALWAQERYVHICAFAQARNQKASSFWTRISRPSQRREF